MRFALLHKVLLFALSAVSATPVVISGEIGDFCGPAFAIFALFGWFLPETLMKKPQYRAVATLIVVVIFLIQSVRVLTGEHLAVATIEFSLLLLAVKLCMRSEFGDFQQIVLMAFVAQIAATVTSYNISYGVFFLAFVFLAPVSMFMTQIRKEMEVRFTKADSVVQLRLANSSRIITGKNAWGPLVGTLALLILTVLIFLSIPRWGFGLGTGGLIGKQLPGFSKEVKIGDLTSTMNSQVVYLRLWPLTQEQERSPQMNLKFRGAVFDTYDSGRWLSHTGEQFRYPSARDGQYALFFPTPPVTASFRIMQESTEPPYLFVPENAVTVNLERNARRGRQPYPRLQINENGVIKYPDRRKVGIQYIAQLGHTGMFSGQGTDSPSAFLQLPANAERIGDLAAQWTKGAQTPEEQIQRILTRFQYTFGYTRTVSPAEQLSASEEEIVYRFLFDYQRGTCEHFATAATLMFRTLGIPSRFVTGFQGAKWNSVGEYYTVDASSAHAWTEVLVNGSWHTVDATPQSTEGASSSSSPGALYIREFIDMLSMRWHQYVIDYNETTQAALFSKMLPGASNSTAPRVSISPGHLVLTALLVLVIFLLFKRKQFAGWRQLFRRTASSPHAPSTALLLRLEKKLQPATGPRAKGQTPAAFLEMVAATHPSLSSFLQTFSQAYHSDRFGKIPMSPAMHLTLKKQIEELKVEKQRFPAEQ
jgi:protein-glutamine gamma-glutamyltransferase